MLRERISTRPAPEHPGDVVPGPDEFAGWPRLGVESAVLTAGPSRVHLQRVDRSIADSLERWARMPGAGLVAGEGWTGLDIALEFTRADRPGYLALVPGGRARLVTWAESGGHAMATHGAALLVNEDGSRGIVTLARQLEPDLDLALQNVLRVALAWRLALTGRGLLLHAAALERGDEAVMLLGPSGAGKTTALGLSAPWPAVADDVVVLTAPRADGPWLLHPTPLWADPAMESRSARLSPLPLAGALRLAHAPAASIEPLSRASAAAAVLAHAPFTTPAGEGARAALSQQLVSRIPFASLRFARDAAFLNEVDAWLARSAASASQPEDSRA